MSISSQENEQPIRKRSGHTLALRLLALCFILTGLFLLTPQTPTAHADGGAPNLAYVAGGGKGISVIDIAQQKVTANIALDGDPAMLYLTLDGSYLYAAQPALNKISMLDTSTQKVVCTASVSGQPSLLTFDPGANLLYVAGNRAAKMTAIEGNTCTIKKTITTNGPVYGLAEATVGPGTNGGTGNQIWFTTSSGLHVYTLPNHIQNIPVSGSPQYLSIPPGATVYVTTRQGNLVGVSLQTLQATSPLLSGGDFGPMDFDENTSEIYVPDRKANVVDVLNPIYYGSSIPKEPNHTINVGVTPQSVAITSDGNLGFFALTGGNVAMYDIPGKQLSNTFFVGGTPRFIITGLYPPTVRNSPQNTASGSPIPTSALVLMAVVALLILLIIGAIIFLVRGKKG